MPNCRARVSSSSQKADHGEEARANWSNNAPSDSPVCAALINEHERRRTRRQSLFLLLLARSSVVFDRLFGPRAGLGALGALERASSA